MEVIASEIRGVMKGLCFFGSSVLVSNENKLLVCLLDLPPG